MSTILKALRRLEHEKSARADRPLSEAVANTPSPPPKRRSARWLIAGGSIAGALAIGVTVFAIARSGDEVERTDAVEIASAEKQAPPARVPAAQRQRRDAARAAAAARSGPQPSRPGTRADERRARRTEPAAPAGLPPAALTSEVGVVKRIRPAAPAVDPSAPETPPAAVPRRPAEKAASHVVPRRPEQETVVPKAVPRRPEQGTAVPKAVPRQSERDAAAPAGAEESDRRAVEPAPRESAARRAAAAEEEERVQLASAAPAVKPPPTRSEERRPEPVPSEPRAAEPAPILRSPVPTVFVEQTIWHPDAGRRVAVVELEGSEERLRLHEGDAVGPLVVRKIEPSGVFFYHDGVELRRRVGAR